MSTRVLLLWAAGVVVTGCRATPLDAVTTDPHTLLTGLVAHWPFDEGSGTMVLDHSGNGLNGTLVGGTWISAGRFGGALQLALKDTITFPNFPQATPNWTVSVWLWMSKDQLAANVANGDYGTILSTELACRGGWELQFDNHLPPVSRFTAAYWVGAMDGCVPSGDASTSSGDGSTSSGAYVVNPCQCAVANQWIHLLAVFDDDAKQFTLYDNGAVVDRMTMPGAIQTGDGTLYIGKWSQEARPLAADLDDFAIWSRALSAGEVAILSQQSPPD
jgi:Concanavalin A-like lectin/glucanases superfamily